MVKTFDANFFSDYPGSYSCNIGDYQSYAILKKIQSKIEENNSKPFWVQKIINFLDVYQYYTIETNSYCREILNNNIRGSQIMNPKFCEVKNKKVKKYKCNTSEYFFSGNLSKIKMYHFVNTIGKNINVIFDSQEYIINKNCVIFIPEKFDKLMKVLYNDDFKLIQLDFVFNNYV